MLYVLILQMGKLRLREGEGLGFPSKTAWAQSLLHRLHTRGLEPVPPAF